MASMVSLVLAFYLSSQPMAATGSTQPLYEFTAPEIDVARRLATFI